MTELSKKIKENRDEIVEATDLTYDEVDFIKLRTGSLTKGDINRSARFIKNKLLDDWEFEPREALLIIDKAETIVRGLVRKEDTKFEINDLKRQIENTIIKIDLDE